MMGVRLLGTVLIVCVTLTASAQQAAPLSKSAEAIKRKAGSLVAQAKISVIPHSGSEEYGTFLSNDAQALTFFDIDRKLQVTMRYEDVKKLKDGYGGYNSIQGRHTDRTKGLVVSLVVVGALAGLIAAVATAKD